MQKNPPTCVVADIWLPLPYRPPDWDSRLGRTNQHLRFVFFTKSFKMQKTKKMQNKDYPLPPPQGREEAWGSPLLVKALPRWLGGQADDMLRLDRRAISRRQKEKRGLPGQPGSPPSCEYFRVFVSCLSGSCLICEIQKKKTLKNREKPS